MTSAVRHDDIDVGAELPTQRFPVTRLDLVKYCGASGDFNVIHWNARAAQSVGLPDVIAHGMYSMALAARVVTDWVGDPAAVIEYGVRFATMLVVPDDDIGTVLEVSGRVVDKLDDNRVRVELTARGPQSKVLTQARAVVQLG